MFNLMSLQMLRQWVDKVFTNPFPVANMPEELGEALQAAGRGEISLNPPVPLNLKEQRFRGRVSYDKTKCIGCKMCIKVCPANAITFITEEKKVQVHSDRCCFCAQCTEICPVNCLAMSNDFAFASYERNEEEVIVKDSGDIKVKLENVVKVLEAEPVQLDEDTLVNEELVEEEVKPKYEIDPEKCIGCTKCARLCPVDAITGKVKEPHVIDKQVCIACGQCADGCPVGAIFLEDLGEKDNNTPAEIEVKSTESDVVEETKEEVIPEVAPIKVTPKSTEPAARKRAPRKKKEETE